MLSTALRQYIQIRKYAMEERKTTTNWFVVLFLVGFPNVLSTDYGCIVFLDQLLYPLLFKVHVPDFLPQFSSELSCIIFSLYSINLFTVN